MVFLPEHNSAAPVSWQIVDIPVGGRQGFRPKQVSTASASLPRSADEAVQEFISKLFPISKKRAVCRRGSSARVATHSSSWTPAASESGESYRPSGGYFSCFTETGTHSANCAEDRRFARCSSWIVVDMPLVCQRLGCGSDSAENCGSTASALL